MISTLFVLSVILFVIFFGICYMLVTLWLPWWEAKEEKRKKLAELPKEEFEALQAKTTTTCNFCGAQTKSPQVFTKTSSDGKHYWWCGKCSVELLEAQRAAKAEKERLAELEAGRKAEEEERKKWEMVEEKERKRLAELETRKKAKEEERKKLVELKEELEAMQKNVPNIFIDDIKSFISQNKIEEANRLLLERKNDYTRFLELNKEMKDIDIKLAKLSSKLAEGEITSDAYETANDNLVRRKRDVEEGLWKLQNRIFREKYEKPF